MANIEKDIKYRKQIGQRIYCALVSKNIKQYELAKAIGVTDNTISYFVSGKRTPNTEQIIKIAVFLNVSADYLLGLDAVNNQQESFVMLNQDICERLIKTVKDLNTLCTAIRCKEKQHGKL